MDDRRYEELARRLADYPGRWIPWPVPFGTRAEADQLFESLRDGGCEAFRVDSAAFRWRMDEFTVFWVGMPGISMPGGTTLFFPFKSFFIIRA